MKLVLDRLPAKAREYAELIGLEATLMLVQRRGGQILWPAKGGDEFAALAADIGEVAAGILARHYREYINIPMCTQAVRAAMREFVRQEFDRLTLEEGMSARKAVRAMAGKPPHGYAERTIWDILSRAEEGAVADVAPARNTNQIDLF